MNRWSFFALIMAMVSWGCDKYYLSVQKAQVNRDYLASTFVQSPDPAQENPPFGEILVVKWAIPHFLLQEKPWIELDIFFRNYTTQSLKIPLTERYDYYEYSLLNQAFEEKEGIISYRARVIRPNGEVYREWTHQLWVPLIQVEDEVPFSPAPIPESASSESLFEVDDTDT